MSVKISHESDKNDNKKKRNVINININEIQNVDLFWMLVNACYIDTKHYVLKWWYQNDIIFYSK